MDIIKSKIGSICGWIKYCNNKNLAEKWELEKLICEVNFASEHGVERLIKWRKSEGWGVDKPLNGRDYKHMFSRMSRKNVIDKLIERRIKDTLRERVRYEIEARQKRNAIVKIRIVEQERKQNAKLKAMVR
jgi:hypothetical protein